MREYVKTFNIKNGNKDKNNKLMSSRRDDDKLIEKYKTIWIKIEGLWNIKLNVLPVYDNRYIKTKIRTYVDKVYTNFRDVNIPEHGVESFTIIFIDSLLVYENK